MTATAAHPRVPARTQREGLSAAEVADRRARGEGNVVRVEASRSYRRILIENAFTIVNVILFAIAIFLIVLGLYGDALMTAGLVLLNVIVGVAQETRAKRQLDQIALLTKPSAAVIRDGREVIVDPSEIVRGDLLVARPGDQILVDGRVIVDDELSVDESLLTGESDLVSKRVGDPVYSGSFVMAGSASYEAEQVGEESMAARLTQQARSHRDVRTPLQREVGLVIRVMLLLVAALGAQVANSYLHLYHELPLRDSVRAAAVLIALVPQGLVLMVTVTYALAAVRISGKGALVQRMNAVESTSHIAVLCLDKTGTLTSNKLALHAVEPLGIDESELRRILGDYAASTRAGNKTNDAIATACPGSARRFSEAVPFASSHKWSGFAFDDPELCGTYVLGAPEILQPALRTGSGLGERATTWRDQGLRVLLLAFRPEIDSLHEGGVPKLPPGLIPLGSLSFSDELRPEAKETIEGFAKAGIDLKVISGDNPETVAALAKQAGLDAGGRIYSGLQIDQLDDGLLAEIARETTIFGRITPAQKERLVRVLRHQGYYVAMIGDGVNDVLALKQANLAVAMRSGSQVTRSVADIVLMNDSFAVLPAALLEGQRILKGMQDIIRLFLTRTTYVALVILLTSLIGEPFPVTPKQNALLALLTVGIPTLGLAAWAKPGKPDRKIVLSSGNFVLFGALTIVGVALAVYELFMQTTGDLNQARSALTTTTVLCGLLLVPFVEPPNAAWEGAEEVSGDWRPTILAAVMLALYAAVLAIAPLRDFYELDLLPWSGYVIIALAVLGWATMVRYLWRLRLPARFAAWRQQRRARAATT
jgi:cation-transporting ATPase E